MTLICFLSAHYRQFLSQRGSHPLQALSQRFYQENGCSNEIYGVPCVSTAHVTYSNKKVYLLRTLFLCIVKLVSRKFLIISIIDARIHTLYHIHSPSGSPTKYSLSIREFPKTLKRAFAFILLKAGCGGNSGSVGRAREGAKIVTYEARTM